ncbi:MAG: hypothetical protein RR285_10305 [Acinetobacter sp.]
MNKTIKTIALSVSVAFLSSAALAGGGHHVQVNTGLQDTLDLLAQNATNGSALNLAINTNSIDATVNTAGGINKIGEIETSAIGAVNTGNITLEQGSVYQVSSGAFSGEFEASLNAWKDMSGYHHSHLDEGVEAAVSGSVDTEYYQELNSTLSNYAAANLAFNSGSVDASVNTKGFKNTIDSIKTSAIGAANTGSITVTVK